MSAGALRPRLIAVWALLLALGGVILAVELMQRGAQRAASERESRDRMLLPLAVEELGAIELAHAGTLHRFERDAAGNWFYHGVHAAAQAAHEHATDPAIAGRIAQAFAALGRARIERQFEADMRVNDYGMAAPELLILAYRPKEPLPLVQYAVGDLAPDQFSRYVQAVGSSSVITIANYQVDNLLGLIQFVGASADEAAAPTERRAQ